MNILILVLKSSVFIQRFEFFQKTIFTWKFEILSVFPLNLLKLINNSLSLNKGNHDRDGVWISDLN